MPLLSLILFLYLLILLWCIIDWYRYKKISAIQANNLSNVSIIIPVRNEERSIGKLLEDIIKQTYKKDNYEVIIVNDHSSDSTKELVGKFLDKVKDNRFRLIDMKVEAGKKASIAQGVKESEMDIILTTDGDCRVKKDWLIEMMVPFQDPNIHLVAGLVNLLGDSFFALMQQVEFASLQGIGGITLRNNLPTMANGANLAFRKKSFIQVGGYKGNEHIASGDDEFLLRKIHHHFPGGLFFMSDMKGSVESRACNTLGEFWNQRVRWASKWKMHKDIGTKLLGLTVILVQFSFLAGLLISGIRGESVSFFMALFAGKIVLEFLFIQGIRLKSPVKTFIAVLIWQVLYPVYAISVGIASLKGNYIWKERKYKI